MDMPLTVTFGQLIGGFLALCGGISCVGLAVSYIVKAVKAAHAPAQKQDDRLEALEKATIGHQEMLARDKARLDKLDETQAMMLRANYALLGHALDGNDIESLKASKNEIKQWLFNR